MRLIGIIFGIFFALSAKAQDEYWVELRGKAGFLAAHRPIMGHLATQHAFAGELSFYQQARGKRAWQQAYKMPLYGISLFYGSVGNNELLGHYTGLNGFVNFPLVRFRSYTLSGKMAAGLGYGSKIYDSEGNILSVPVSTHVNAMVVMGLDSRFVIKNKHELVVGIDMTHFSNGAAKVPNLGINLPYLSLGYGYRVRSGKSDSVVVHPPFKKKWEFGAIGVLSFKEVFPIGKEKYPIYAGSILARRYFKRNVAAEMSFDVISKQAIMAYHKDVPKSQLDIIQLGIFSGFILPMDRLHILIGMGYYVRDMFQPEDAFYHRVGLRYVWRNGINMNLVLKSHWARADYVEYGIGYTFKR